MRSDLVFLFRRSLRRTMALPRRSRSWRSSWDIFSRKRMACTVPEMAPHVSIKLVCP